jgi:hypothetical protein
MLLRVELGLYVVVPLIRALLLAQLTELQVAELDVWQLAWLHAGITAPVAAIILAYSLRSIRFRNTFVR